MHTHRYILVENNNVIEVEETPDINPEIIPGHYILHDQTMYKIETITNVTNFTSRTVNVIVEMSAREMESLYHEEVSQLIQ